VASPTQIAGLGRPQAIWGNLCSLPFKGIFLRLCHELGELQGPHLDRPMRLFAYLRCCVGHPRPGFGGSGMMLCRGMLTVVISIGDFMFSLIV